jgi:F420-dependent oxidoreductase-like protein
MRVGIFVDLGRPSTIDQVVTRVSQVAEDGFSSAWFPQIFGLDALTTIAVVGREVPRLTLGTSVVPTYPRHPMTLAQQAMTAQAASQGRLVLGIGLSHQMVIEGMFGMSFDKPARHMREYLSVLLPLVRDGSVSFEGETLKGVGSITIPDAEPFPVVLAALAPRMLELAGAVADGTVTWMTGPGTIADHIVPSITAAAAEAGRPAPQVICALPVCVTEDVAAARARAAKVFVAYGQLPSYRAMLDKEGAAGPADVVIAGDDVAVRDQIVALDDAGVTDFVAVEFAAQPEERERTRALLKTLV